MCNFVLRPIKSYATVDVQAKDALNVIKRGDFVTVQKVEDGKAVCVGNDDVVYEIDLTTFVHCFTANPDDIKRVKDEEYKTMGYDPKKAAKA